MIGRAASMAHVRSASNNNSELHQKFDAYAFPTNENWSHQSDGRASDRCSVELLHVEGQRDRCFDEVLDSRSRSQS